MSSNVSNSNFGNGTTIFQGNIYNDSSDLSDQCLKDLRITDPRDDKTRIEETKGNLLRDSYCWILDHADFKMWLNDPQCRLLWIKGDPGKGKTMLLCGIINELEKFATYRLSYFFCQETDSNLRSATAVLRGLIYSLVVQQPSLISYVREKYNHAGKRLFEDRNAWTALSKMLKAILNDPNLKNAVFIIDALDECIEERQNLLNLLNEITSSSCAKWIVSSRNRVDIENELEHADQKIKLCLELNEDSIAAAVQTYIRYKVNLLAQKHSYDNKLRNAAKSYLISNANNTFLWVALVCQNLNKIRSGKVMEKLMTYPRGLNSLYTKRLDQILELHDEEDVSLCKEILTIISTVYRPVTLHELYSLIANPTEFPEDISSLRMVISLCGSFLTIRGDTIYFIHQSAKDYLITKKAWSTISALTTEDVHYSIFSQSLRSMNNTIRRDIYCLDTPGYHIDHIQPHDPDPLITVRYSCIYWIDHLCDYGVGNSINDAIQEGGLIDVFLRCHFLHWLETFSLLRSIPEGTLAIIRLTNLLREQTPKTELFALVEDANRFTIQNSWIIEYMPLQVYVSALIFSPLQSKIRIIFKDEEPSWILLKPAVEANWGACLQTLQGHNGPVNSVVFSFDGQRLASGSSDNTVRVWDANSGTFLQILQGHERGVTSVAFSPLNSQRLASGSADLNTVRIWDANSGACLQVLEGHRFWVSSVVFSPNGQQLASGSHDNTIKLWDVNSSTCLHTLKGHEYSVLSVGFSPNSQWIASGSIDRTVQIWDANSGACLQVFKGHRNWVSSVAFSPNGQQLASGSYDSMIKLWDVNSGTYLHTLRGDDTWITSVDFSPIGQRLASSSMSGIIRVWDTNSGAYLHTSKGYNPEMSVVFSPNGERLASGSLDTTVRLWDANSGTRSQIPESNASRITLLVISLDGRRVASYSRHNITKVWDTTSGACLQTFERFHERVTSLVFSFDNQQLAVRTRAMDIMRVLDVNSGNLLHFLNCDSQEAVARFPLYDQRLASESDDDTLRTLHLPGTLPRGAALHGYGITSNGTWITKDSQPLVWLPLEYRPTKSLVFKATVIIGCKSGQVLIMRFSAD